MEASGCDQVEVGRGIGGEGIALEVGGGMLLAPGGGAVVRGTEG